MIRIGGRSKSRECDWRWSSTGAAVIPAAMNDDSRDISTSDEGERRADINNTE